MRAYIRTLSCISTDLTRGKCPYGYGNFYIDATRYVSFTEPNDIKVIVKNGVPSGRWYTAAVFIAM